LEKDQHELEMVQRRSVRWISKLKKQDSVTVARESLDLDLLSDRRNIKDISILEDIKTQRIDIDLSKYTQQTSSHINTRNHATQQHSNTTPFYHSYFVRAFRKTGLSK